VSRSAVEQFCWSGLVTTVGVIAGVSAAAQQTRYVASAIARWSTERASRFSASLVVGGATRALESVKVRGDRRRSYTT
jgi:hypothetical protein